MKLKNSILLAGVGVMALTLATSTTAFSENHHDVSRVLLISVDGMHASDLKAYVASHQKSALASLSRHGTVYPNALTSAPSDSFPGLLAQVTGGSSKSHGVFYDVSYDRTLFAAGSNCAGTPGTQPALDEHLDKDPLSYTGGGTLGDSLSQINNALLPLALRDGKCTPVLPHQFIKTNTIFEVIKANGGHTAWADKHPAYEILNGPSGHGVDDLFTPEVNSNDSLTGADTTTGFHSVQRNDALKVTAVLNEMAGLKSTGSTYAGVPTIFGMNFQSVSVRQKLAKGNTKDPQDAGLIGGYADAVGAQPNNGLASGLDFVDTQLQSMLDALEKNHLREDTLIIVSAKHGQSPINLAQRTAVDDSPYTKTPGFAASITDDVGLVWLAPDAQKKQYEAAEAYLKSQFGPLGITKLLDRDDLKKLYQDPFSDNRTPDFVAITKQGLIYTGGTKLAEHGGFSKDDRNVTLLVSKPSMEQTSVDDVVETKQIAPTILKALGIDPSRLNAVKMERTAALPGLDHRDGDHQDHDRQNNDHENNDHAE